MKKTSSLTIALFFVLVLSLSGHAAGNQVWATITSQPSNLHANQDYTLNFHVNDTATKTVNVTALFYVNNVNVQNATWTNNLTNVSLNNFTTTFSHTLYEYQDSVRANITIKEALNNSVSNSTATNTISILDSTSDLIAADAFDFLPNMGSALGDFIHNLFTGLLPAILTLAVLGMVVALIYGITLIVRIDSVTGKFRRK